MKAYAWLLLATTHCGFHGRKGIRILETLTEQMTAEELSEAEELAAELKERIRSLKISRERLAIPCKPGLKRHFPPTAIR